MDDRQSDATALHGTCGVRARARLRDKSAGDTTTLDLARKILTGELPDISQGATSFYTPAIMPKEGESTQGFDVGNELETVPGVMGKNRLPARNYKPRWSKGAVRIYTPSIPEREMKFFKVNGL